MTRHLHCIVSSLGQYALSSKTWCYTMRFEMSLCERFTVYVYTYINIYCTSRLNGYLIDAVSAWIYLGIKFSCITWHVNMSIVLRNWILRPRWPTNIGDKTRRKNAFKLFAQNIILCREQELPEVVGIRVSAVIGCRHYEHKS